MTRSSRMRVGKQVTQMPSPRAEDFIVRREQSQRDKIRNTRCGTGSDDLNAGSVLGINGSPTKEETNGDAPAAVSGNTQ